MITFTVTNTILVEESVGETRILSGTFLKLAKPTSNGREYLIEEGQAIADGLLNMDVNYGANWMGKH
ncbi:hypothetical protein KAH94_06695, partial [bacterium]|nr:hypothetical protein [bacterium]